MFDSNQTARIYKECSLESSTVIQAEIAPNSAKKNWFESAYSQSSSHSLTVRPSIDEQFDFIEYTASQKKEKDAVHDELTCLSPSHYNEFLYFCEHRMLPFTRSFLLADTAFLFRFAVYTRFN